MTSLPASSAEFLATSGAPDAQRRAMEMYLASQSVDLEDRRSLYLRTVDLGASISKTDATSISTVSLFSDSKANSNDAQADMNNSSSSSFEFNRRMCERPLKRQWEFVNITGEPYSPRTGHTAVQYKDNVYIFGGTDSEKRQNDMHKLCLRTFAWSKVEPRFNTFYGPVLPLKRSGAKGIVYQDRFIIFGGYDGRGGNYFNDIYAYDFAKAEWSEIKADNEDSISPAPRTDHSLVLYNDKMWVFGGFDGRNRLNDLFSFDLKECKWTQVDASASGQARMEIETEVPHNGRERSKLIPCERFAHSAAIFNDEMYIFGGWNGTTTLNSLWKYNFALNQWIPVGYGNELSSRAYSAFPFVPASMLNINNNAEGEREREPDARNASGRLEPLVKTGPKNWPQHRYRHTSTVFKDKMFVFGGVDKYHNRFTEVDVFDFVKLEWSLLPVCGVIPESRTFHPVLEMDGFMYIFGGYNGDVRLNDICRLFIGKLPIPPLEVLAANVARQHHKKLKVSVANMPSPLRNGVFWKRDSNGHLRGPVVPDGLLLPGPVLCQCFESSTTDDMSVDEMECDYCAECGYAAEHHERIPETPKPTMVGKMRSILKQNLNLCKSVAECDLDSKSKRATPCKTVLNIIKDSVLNSERGKIQDPNSKKPCRKDSIGSSSSQSLRASKKTKRLRR